MDPINIVPGVTINMVNVQDIMERMETEVIDTAAMDIKIITNIIIIIIESHPKMEHYRHL
jgi:2-keto-3-deoxy-galactonokinase